MATIQGQQIKGNSLAPGEEIKGSSIQGVQTLTPITPVGQAVNGANEDQAKMAGTPAQKDKALLDRVEAPKTTADRLEEEKLASQPTEQEMTEVTKYDQMEAAFPALAELDTAFKTSVLDALASQSAELGPALNIETVKTLFPEETPDATITEFLDELRQYDIVQRNSNRILTFLQTATSIKSQQKDPQLSALFEKYNLKVADAYKLLDPSASLMEQLADNLPEEVTLEDIMESTNRIPIQVPALPGQEAPSSEEYLTTLFGASWKDMTWKEVKQAVSNLRSSFTDLYQVESVASNAASPLWMRNLAKETLRDMGIAGAITAEDKIGNLELQIIDNDSIMIGTTEYTIEELLDNPQAMGDLVSLLDDEVALQEFIDNPETAELGNFLVANAVELRAQYAPYTLNAGSIVTPFAGVDAAAEELDYESFFEDEQGEEYGSLTGAGIPSQFIFNIAGAGDITPEEADQIQAAWDERTQVLNLFETSGVPPTLFSQLGIDLNAARPLPKNATLDYVVEQLNGLSGDNKTKFVAFLQAADEILRTEKTDTKGLSLGNYINSNTWRLLKGQDPNDYVYLLETQATFNPEDVIDSNGKIKDSYITSAFPAVVNGNTGPAWKALFGGHTTQLVGVIENRHELRYPIYIKGEGYRFLEQRVLYNIIFPPELQWLDLNRDGVIDKDAYSKIERAVADGNFMEFAVLNRQLKEGYAFIQKEVENQIETAKQEAEEKRKAHEEFLAQWDTTDIAHAAFGGQTQSVPLQQQLDGYVPGDPLASISDLAANNVISKNTHADFLLAVKEKMDWLSFVTEMRAKGVPDEELKAIKEALEKGTKPVLPAGYYTKHKDTAVQAYPKGPRRVLADVLFSGQSHEFVTLVSTGLNSLKHLEVKLPFVPPLDRALESFSNPDKIKITTAMKNGGLDWEERLNEEKKPIVDIFVNVPGLGKIVLFSIPNKSDYWRTTTGVVD